MRLPSLRLEQFRNYDALECHFSDADVSVLVGGNGAGKTNILEAISVLSTTKSCEGAADSDIVQWGREYYRVRGEIVSDGGEKAVLEVVSVNAPRMQKACFQNDVRIRSTQMVGQLPTVIFLPQELDLFTGSPAHRRDFLDRLLSQVSPEYVAWTHVYGKIIKQRNALLQKIAEGTARRSDLLAWNERLAEAGSAMMEARMELIEVLQCTLGAEFVSLGEEWDDAAMIYETKVQSRGRKEMQGELLHLLDHYTERDIIVRSTTVGPHRDDWAVVASGHDIAAFASRGQQRTAVLALLFLAVSFLELRRGEKPVILLDDVFSELDDAHQEALLGSLHGYQTIITTTHLPQKEREADIWEVTRGGSVAKLARLQKPIST